MNIPPNTIENWIIKHFDYKKRVGKKGPELVIANPFHGNDKKKFNISLTKAICHDWRGDDWAPISPESGDRNCSFIKFVQLYRNCSYREAVLEVLGAAGKAFLYARAEDRPEPKELEESPSVALPVGTKPLSPSDKQACALYKWLGSRGYSIEDVARYNLYHLGMDVYWPYYEYGVLVYWQSRSRLNKRFNFPSANKEYLYGFDDVEPASYLILTESIFDKHTLGDQVLASGGAALDNGQVKKIKILGPRDGIILSPDNDVAGIKSIIENAKILIRVGYLVFYSIPPKIYNGIEVKDWNDLLVKCDLSRSMVRELHDNNIIRYNIKNSAKLYSLI
jgi:hypothetical protein